MMRADVEESVSAAALTCRTLLGDYPVTRALRRGLTQSPLLRFDFADVAVPHKAFKRVVRDLEFDVAELALMTFLMARSRHVPLRLLPVVLFSRNPLKQLVYRRDRADIDPRALAGCRIGALVETGITIAVDDAPLHPVLVESRPPSLDALSGGTGTIRVRWVAELPPLATGAHRLFFRNTHHRDIGVYLANVLVPSNDRVAVTGQDRDVDQRELTVSFDLQPAQVRRSKWIAPAAIGGAAMAAALVRGRRRRAGAREQRARERGSKFAIGERALRDR